MRNFLVFVILLLVPSLRAQTPAPPAAQAAKPGEQDAKSAPGKPDPKLHADVVKLVELSGARKRLEDSLPSMVEDGKKEMMKRCPECSPEFAEEWGKRMLARLKIDAFLDVFAAVYEKNFTDDEILELIRLQEKSTDPQPPAPSTHLKEKLTSNMPTIMSEIMGGCVQVASKLGGEIGKEIEKEHPEYTKAKPEKQ